MHYRTLTLALSVLVCSVAAAQELVPPEVGDIAPAIGDVRWLQTRDEDGGRVPTLDSLRGQVVVIHTYGHYCDP